MECTPSKIAPFFPFVLNIAKVLGYWPFKLNLDVITAADMDVNFSSLPPMVNARHIVVDEEFLKKYFNPKLYKPLVAQSQAN